MGYGNTLMHNIIINTRIMFIYFFNSNSKNLKHIRKQLGMNTNISTEIRKRLYRYVRNSIRSFRHFTNRR